MNARIALSLLCSLAAGACDADEEPPARESTNTVSEAAPGEGRSTSCLDAAAVVPGRLVFDLRVGDSVFPGDCAEVGRATIRRLTLAERSRLRVRTQNSGAALISVTAGCGERSETLLCDGFEGDARLRLDQVVEPGDYFISVARDDSHVEVNDGSEESVVVVDVETVVASRARCRAAPALDVGAPFEGTTAGEDDRFTPPCHEYENGPEAMHRLVLEEAARVRFTVHTSGTAALWVGDACPMTQPHRAACAVLRAREELDADDADNSPAALRAHPLRWTVPLGTGTHYVFVDAMASEGAEYALAAEILSVR